MTSNYLMIILCEDAEERSTHQEGAIADQKLSGNRPVR